MESCTRLTRAELGDLIAAVFHQNGHEVSTVGFYDLEGRVIDLVAEVSCRIPDLSIPTTHATPEQQAIERMTQDTLAILYSRVIDPPEKIPEVEIGRRN